MKMKLFYIAVYISSLLIVAFDHLNNIFTVNIANVIEGITIIFLYLVYRVFCFHHRIKEFELLKTWFRILFLALILLTNYSSGPLFISIVIFVGSECLYEQFLKLLAIKND